MGRLGQFILILLLVACGKHSENDDLSIQEMGSSNAFATTCKQLEGLAWLVGNWTSIEDDSTFTTSNQWDKYSNFLTQTFSLSNAKDKDLFGKQIIGWDSRQGKIRSWIFDSEGGFGEGTWYQDGDSWYVTVLFTMADGSLATSTQVYTMVDANSYQFSSTNRDIDGVILPNIEPFILTRK